jgi:nitrile hydratase beta subunit
MDGIHDLGGMSGFGPVEIERGEPVFHERWQARAYGLNVLGIAVLRAYNVHEYRHAVERMDPRHYLAASYYERWFTGVASLMIEKGVLTREELEERAGGAVPLSRPPTRVVPSSTSTPDRARFAAGQSVVVRDIHPRGHTRVPRYVRGRRGVVVRVAPRFIYPDVAGHGMHAHREPTYHVEFQARDLWTDAAGSGETVVVDLWESYLEACG